MGKYLEQALSPQALNHAWRILRNDRGQWVRGLPVQKMEADVLRHVMELADAVKTGRYRCEPMRCFEIDKADGGKRTICAAAVRDKLLQRAVLLLIEPLGEAIFHDASYGYRPQCNRDMAIAKVREWVRRGYTWVGDADIRACFDNIPHQGALKKLKDLCGDKELTALAGQWIGSVPPAFQPAGRGVGLPQGMVMSPFLCNLYLHELDTLLSAKGIPFVRFADDFVLFAKDEKSARKALDIAGKHLRKLKLELHPDKTRVIKSSSQHRFLGHRLPDAKPRFRLF